MAKKFGKFLLGMAAIGGAAVATYYYLQKKNAILLTPESIDEDYDDFTDELKEDADRNYVQLNTENAQETVCNETASEENPEVAVEEAVEEFFDEETTTTE